ncbi:nucleoside phosphorylase domain-containing protein [Stachybotrys elegans]|uniref:Nucleoside phosphorylase domain-containing protein n=1 Tax=Stachybotrys elegans TaxID=80388 RepID=A0A8K0SYL8_9HYPO|nr:nucleoside phosphorylase domain-containing protein [Stachybotrys elegans]
MDMPSTVSRPTDRGKFHIAIICALAKEANAVIEVLNPESAEWESFGKAVGDTNSYTTGAINRHHVVVVYSGTGTIKTATTAGNLFRSFPNISLVLVVGICGGVPNNEDRELRDMYLGDLVISSHVVDYTFVKQYPTESTIITRRDDQTTKQHPDARNFVRKFEMRTFQKKLQNGIKAELKHQHDMDPITFPEYPGATKDRLFKAEYQHQHRDGQGCEDGLCSADSSTTCKRAYKATCNELKCASIEGAYAREKPAGNGESTVPAIHVGTFGSGNTVMKSGTDRDRIAWQENIDAFEMEAVGVWDQCPTIIFKAVCDYADSHKSKEWQAYAAGIAAIGLRVLLHFHHEFY